MVEWMSMELMGLKLAEEQRLSGKKETLSQCHVVCRKSHMYWLATGSVPPKSDAQINVISISDVEVFIVASRYHITVFAIVGDVEINWVFL